MQDPRFKILEEEEKRRKRDEYKEFLRKKEREMEEKIRKLREKEGGYIKSNGDVNLPNKESSDKTDGNNSIKHIKVGEINVNLLQKMRLRIKS